MVLFVSLIKIILKDYTGRLSAPWQKNVMTISMGNEMVRKRKGSYFLITRVHYLITFLTSWVTNYTSNGIYNKILDRDWFSARLFVN